MFLGLLASGDVLADQHEADQVALGVAARLNLQFRPVVAAVLGAGDHLDPAAPPRGVGVVDRFQRRRVGVLGAHQPGRRRSDGFLQRIAVEAGEACIDPADLAIPVRDHHDVRGMPHHLGQALQLRGHALGQRTCARLAGRQQPHGQRPQQGDEGSDDAQQAGRPAVGVVPEGGAGNDAKPKRTPADLHGFERRLGLRDRGQQQAIGCRLRRHLAAGEHQLVRRLAAVEQLEVHLSVDARDRPRQQFGGHDRRAHDAQQCRFPLLDRARNDALAVHRQQVEEAGPLTGILHQLDARAERGPAGTNGALDGL